MSGPDRPGAADARAQVQLCAFRIGDVDCAVDLMRVRAVVPPVPVAPLRGAPAIVEGVARLRGDPLPVVDLRRRLGRPAGPPTRATRLLVVAIARRRVALVVDEVCEVLRLPRAALRPAADGVGAPVVVGACRGEPGDGGAGRDGGRVRLLLDVRALLDPGLPPEAAARALEAARR